MNFICIDKSHETDKTEIGQFRKGENKGNGLLPNWIEPYERKGARHNVYFMSITTSA